VRDAARSREYQRRYRAAHREQVAAYQRKYRRTHPEVFKRAEDKARHKRIRARAGLQAGESAPPPATYREKGQDCMTGIEIDGRPMRKRPALDHGDGNEVSAKALRGAWAAGWGVSETDR